MDLVILNHGQVTRATPELASSLLTSTEHQRKDVSALDRFSVYRCPTRRVFSGTGLDIPDPIPLPLGYRGHIERSKKAKRKLYVPSPCQQARLSTGYRILTE
ncbi:hypothetical protein TNCV_5015251 [Trichonephila clavipes]|nr:hypothetical protein TNCV_5015251 [Trichonephila clavipes]